MAIDCKCEQHDHLFQLDLHLKGPRQFELMSKSEKENSICTQMTEKRLSRVQGSWQWIVVQSVKEDHQIST